MNGGDATRILLEVMKGVLKDASDTPDEAAYRTQVKKEVDEIHAAGGTVDIPKEFL